MVPPETTESSFDKVRRLSRARFLGLVRLSPLEVAFRGRLVALTAARWPAGAFLTASEMADATALSAVLSLRGCRRRGSGAGGELETVLLDVASVTGLRKPEGDGAGGLWKASARCKLDEQSLLCFLRMGCYSLAGRPSRACSSARSCTAM